jgi:peptidoglycan/xylan/chitin deacetylase (PgdA/CDA1 family)
VSFDDMLDYVYTGAPLPPKPVCITFDDGYLSNYTLAFPILRTYNMKAPVFIIGVSVGETGESKDTGRPIIPHFSYAQAREMAASGLVSIQSHTYDMHMADFEENPRTSVLALPAESDADYIAAMRADFAEMSGAMTRELGYAPYVLAYPGGKFDVHSEAVLRALGVRVTLSGKSEMNELVMGLPQCLYGLYRFSAGQLGKSADDVLAYCGSHENEVLPG